MKSGYLTLNPVHQTNSAKVGDRLSVMMGTRSFTGTLTNSISMAHSISPSIWLPGDLSEWIPRRKNGSTQSITGFDKNRPHSKTLCSVIRYCHCLHHRTTIRRGSGVFGSYCLCNTFQRICVEAIDAYHVVGICIGLIVAIFLLITECTFMWGLVYNALERKMSSVWGAISTMGLILFVLSPLQFASACVITFALTRTRTLLTPLTMAIGVSLFFQYIVQPTWYDPNRFTMHGTCICADDGTPLDNGVATYGGDNYKNVTVVKWVGGRQEGKTTTTSSGAYRFQNVLPRGFILKFTVTSTHYHQHGTGASASLKKCTYSAEFFEDVGGIIEIVEKDFALKPDTVETP